VSENDFSLPEGTHTIAMGAGDTCGIMRGKRFPVSHWETTCSGGNAMSMAALALDMTCDVPFALPWEPGVAMVMGRFEGMDHKPVPLDPREALIKQVERAADMGYEVQFGAELEFYLLDPETMLPKDKGIQVYGLDRAAELEHVLGPIRQQINECGIPIEQSNPEYAAGQVEVNIRYDEALLAADRVVMFRTLVKQLAGAHGYKATFMAKPFFEESGNGFHAHYSLWKDGKNVFSDGGKLNAIGRHFVGGMQKRMAEAAVTGSATVNGFRRRLPYTFCPINTSWGIDNRTVGLRVIDGSDNAVRVEKRDAGADANPYYVGIEQGIEPTPMCEGNGYEDADAAPIPTTLETAIRLARGSDWLKGVMGDMRYELYMQMCERELGFYNDFVNSQVTQVERDRYMNNF